MICPNFRANTRQRNFHAIRQIYQENTFAKELSSPIFFKFAYCVAPNYSRVRLKSKIFKNNDAQQKFRCSYKILCNSNSRRADSENFFVTNSIRHQWRKISV